MITGAFLILKLMGLLHVSAWWAVLTLLLDVVFDGKNDNSSISDCFNFKK